MDAFGYHQPQRKRLQAVNEDIERNMGEQPIAGIMQKQNLVSRDLVEASTEHITFKMVSRACKGRWLTFNTKTKIRNALNKAAGKNYSIPELFNY